MNYQDIGERETYDWRGVYNTTCAVAPLFLLFYHGSRHSLDIQMELYINYSVWIHLNIFSWQHIEQLEGYLQI